MTSLTSPSVAVSGTGYVISGTAVDASLGELPAVKAEKGADVVVSSSPSVTASVTG